MRMGSSNIDANGVGKKEVESSIIIEGRANFGRRRIGLALIVLGIMLFGGLFWMSFVLPASTMQGIVPIFMLAFLASYVLILVLMFRGSRVHLKVDRDWLVLTGRLQGRYSLQDATIGRWQFPQRGVDAGAALHVGAGDSRLRIGGRDHRFALTMPLSAEPTDDVEIVISAENFDRLLLASPFVSGSFFRAPPASILVPLVPNPFRLGKKLGPWMATIVFACVISSVIGSLEGTDMQLPPPVAVGLIVASVFVGIVVTVVMSSRPETAKFEIEVSSTGLCLRDVQTKAIVSNAPIGAIGIERGTYRIATRGGVFQYAALILQLPGHGPISLYVPDSRHRWLDDNQHLSKPQFVVGLPEWIVLLETLGLRSVATTEAR